MATVYIASISMQSGSTGTVRAWAGQIEATFLAGTWSQTADTGQTATSALPAATTSNQVVGYQIWRMADGLQATVPCFVKIEYASGNGSVASTQIFATIGTGSDGVGNITGIFFVRTSLFNTGATVQSSVPAYGSATTSRISFACGNGISHCAFCIERSKDASGNNTSDGFMVMGEGNTAGAANIQNFTYIYFDGTLTTNSTKLGAFVPSGSTWADTGGLIGVCPVRFFNGQPSNPCLSWLVYLNGDTASGFPITVSIYGVSRTFMPLGTMMTTVASGNASSALAMLWE